MNALESITLWLCVFALFLIWLIYTRFRGAEYAPASFLNAEKMLEFASITDKDIVYELGSGLGGLTILASFKAKKAVGIEFDPIRCFLSKIRARIFGLKNIEFIRGDIFEEDISDANVVFLFLKQKTNQKLKSKLLKLKKGTRIISNIWTFEGWKPVKEDRERKVYLYIIGKE